MTAPKVRVHEISKVLGVSNAEVIEALERDFDVSVKSHSSTVDQGVADKLIAQFKNGKPAAKKQAAAKAKPAEPTEKPAAKTKSTEKAPEKTPEKPAAQKAAEKPADKPAGKPAAKPEDLAVGVRKQELPDPAKAPPAGTRPLVPDVPAKPAQPQAPAAQRPATAAPTGPRPGMQPGQGQAPRPTAQGAPQPPRPQVSGQPGQARPAQPGMPGQGQRPVAAQAGAPVQPRPGQPGAPMGQRPGAPGQARPQGPQQGFQGRPGMPGGQRPGAPAAQTAQRTPHSQTQAPRRREEEAPVQTAPKVVEIVDPLTVRELAETLALRETEIIKHLFMKGMMVTVNQTLDLDFARELAKELGFEVEDIKVVKHEGEYSHLDAVEKKKLDETEFKNLKGRPPVISIMGHVDHGKTTLLDSIRESRHKVVDTEAGGITQSIGAYTVDKDGQKIVFLDTPGHEAFTAMRMRGAQATDIAILVVAADDGVMPQTIEAINHAKAAKIPIIVAVNKCDKADADPDKVLIQLADYGLNPEKWGGDTLTEEVSALQKLGLDELLDKILLVAELLELKADATVPAEGVIIEAQLDKRTGPVATALIQNGTMRVGDNVLIGSVGGRVRALINDSGERIQVAGPATPVEILGLDGVPNAGEGFRVIHNDKIFKQELALEKQRQRDERLGVNRTSIAGFSGRAETDEDAVKEKQFNLVVKADTQGSLEAVVDVLQRMTGEEVKINIVHSATGEISEADVMLAATAGALIIGFNSTVTPNAMKLAEQQGVNFKLYDVIYHITEELEKWVLGQLDQTIEEVQSGAAEVRQIFKVGKTGIIAGCMVTTGKIVRNGKAVVLRNGKEIFSGTIDNLKRFKDDVKEVAQGYECGISFDRFNDLQEGDIINVFTTKSLERTSF